MISALNAHVGQQSFFAFNERMDEAINPLINPAIRVGLLAKLL